MTTKNYFFAYYFLKVHLHHFSQKKVTKQHSWASALRQIPPASASRPMTPALAFWHPVSHSGTGTDSSRPSTGLTGCRTVRLLGNNKNVHHVCPHFK
jgi:hypothetical protein